MATANDECSLSQRNHLFDNHFQRRIGIPEGGSCTYIADICNAEVLVPAIELVKLRANSIGS